MSEGALALGSSWRDVLTGAPRALFEQALAPAIASRRWFRGKSRPIASAALSAVTPIANVDAVMALVLVRYEDGGTEEYVLPLAGVFGDELASFGTRASHLAVCEIVLADGTPGMVCDALGLPRFQRELFFLFARREVLGGDAAITFRTVGGGLDTREVPVRALTAEQSNTSLAIGDRYILKVTRRLEEGVSADLDMGEFLTSAGYPYAPAVAAAAEVARPFRDPATLAIMHAFVPNQGDAWTVFLALAGEAIRGSEGLPAPQRRLAHVLARRVGELHRVLASRPDLPAFAPEPVARSEREALVSRARSSFDAALRKLKASVERLPPDARRVAETLELRRGDLETRFEAFENLGSALTKTRVHGDLHLGQILFTGEDFALIDFEGEPARPLHERKAKRCPLVDVAGLLRSLHYASVSAARDATHSPPNGNPGAAVPSELGVETRSSTWLAQASAAFLESYRASTENAAFLPSEPSEFGIALDFFVLEKCIYEVHYELDNRPDWVVLPLLGLLRPAV